MEVSHEVDDDNDSENDGDVPWFGRKGRKLKYYILSVWKSICCEETF